MATVLSLAERLFIEEWSQIRRLPQSVRTARGRRLILGESYAQRQRFKLPSKDSCKRCLLVTR